MASTNILIPGEDHFISLADAKEMTLRYLMEKGNIIQPGLPNPNILLTSETFNREAFDTLLAQPKCVGVRAYFGMSPDRTIKLIFVGVDADNKDILPSEAEALGDDEEGGGVIVEEGRPCPPFCPPPPTL